jgi:chromosome partitioning protein
MRILTFSNQKGGVAKTTSALNVAHCLANKGYKTILIDLDPQGNLTGSFLDEPSNNTIFTVLAGECELEEVIVPITENLILIPCNEKFASFERIFATDPNSQYLLKDFIEEMKEQVEEKIDFVVIDTPPALGLITLNALVASNEVYIPMQSQEYSLVGFEKVMETVKKIQKRVNPALEVKGVFFTRHNDRKIISRELTEKIAASFPSIAMKTMIPVNVALEESPTARQSVFDYAPGSKGAIAYEALTNEIINMK